MEANKLQVLILGGGYAGLMAAARLAHFLIRVGQTDMAGVSIQASRVNGEPALIFSRGNEVFTVMVFSFRRQKLWRLYSMRNPEKLRHIPVTALGQPA